MIIKISPTILLLDIESTACYTALHVNLLLLFMLYSVEIFYACVAQREKGYKDIVAEVRVAILWNVG